MVTSTKSDEPKDDLNKRLRSLKIDRGPAPLPAANNRAPKLLLLGIAVLVALVALGYVFLFSGTKTISVATVRTEEGGASAGESVLTASGYVVAHHKIAVGAKVMGRVAWIGVEKGDRVREGQVLVGGHDVRTVTQQSLRDRIGVVSQEAHMFHDTIRGNLLYAKPHASDDELWDAVGAAQIGELVRSLPDGLDTLVGDRGYRLSGGEKARLAIARLLLKAPEIVILDEATAHLDSESEAAVQDALAHALVGRTSLVIAHRLSTIQKADKVLVIDEGRIAEQGTHDELLAANGLYAELYRTQFSRTSGPAAPVEVF